jgi:Uma2 family endonuclease
MKLTVTPNENGTFTLPEGFKYTPGEALTLYTEEPDPSSLFPIVLKTNENCRFTDEQFLEFSHINETFPIFRNANHEIVIEMTMFTKGGERELSIAIEFGIWNKKHKLGRLFGPNSMFTLPDGAMYAPDTSFIAFTRLDAAPPEKKEGAFKIVPEFVLELMSDSDRLSAAQRKMEEVWMENGVEVGVLIDYKKEEYYVYEKDKSAPTKFPFSEPFTHEILPYFSLDLQALAEEWKERE